MQDLSDEERKQILGEALFDELKVIREYLEYLVPVRPDVDKLKEDMVEVKAELREIKAIAARHENKLENHETRLAKLETKQAVL